MSKCTYRYGYKWTRYDLNRKNSTIPNLEGLYIIYCKNEITNRSKIVYIGSTKYFRFRISGHSTIKKVKPFCLAHHTLYFFFTPYIGYFARKRVENFLINTLHPMCNIHRNGFKKKGGRYSHCIEIINNRIQCYFHPILNHT